MKKQPLLLFTFLLVFLVGTASADLLGDRSDLYGDWTGTITFTDLVTGASFDQSLAFTVGSDGTQVQGPTTGYFYFPTTGNMWTGTFPDGSGGQAYYNAGVASGDVFSFYAGVFGSWSASAIFSVASDLMSATLFDGNASWLSGSTYLAYALTGTFSKVHTPIPGAVWLLGSGVLGLLGFRRKLAV